jgi:2'-5' RNA ligase
MADYSALYSDQPAMANHWWWRPGWGVGTRFYTWHITQEENPAVRELAVQYQRALGSFATLDAVPQEWLHMTMQGVGHVSDLPSTAVDSVIDAVAHRVAGIAPINTVYQRAHVFREAIALPPSSPERFAELRLAVRAGIADAIGTCPEDEAGYRPHVSVAYSNDNADAAPIRSALDKARIDAAPATYSKISLIVINRDHRMYEWDTVAEVSLGH